MATGRLSTPARVAAQTAEDGALPSKPVRKRGRTIIISMPIPESTRHSLSERLNRRRVERWPSLSALDIKFRANFAYVKGINRDGAVPLIRLQFAGSASRWGFAIYLASHDGYERAVLPTGLLPARQKRLSIVRARSTSEMRSLGTNASLATCGRRFSAAGN